MVAILRLILFHFLVAVVVGTSAAAQDGQSRHVTFTKAVAPIFQAHCQKCHRPGEAAPMPLLTFDDVRPWAKSIQQKVSQREMPPWHADPAVGRWRNDRRLSDAEIETIVAWVDQGAVRGNPADLPEPQAWTDGWLMGEPDLVFE